MLSKFRRKDLCLKRLLKLIIQLLEQSILLLAITLVVISSAKPMKSLNDNSSPKWWNACGWSAFDSKFVGKSLFSEQELLHKVMKSAKLTKNHAQHIQQNFIENTFNDPIFQNAIYKWLPNIPQTSELVFQKLSTEEAISTSYEFMQYFAVGIEQILIDQQLHDGLLLNQFEEIKYELYQLLCDLQYALHLLNIPQKTNVSRSVMSYEYRDIKELSRRTLRDFIILREYINATHFIANLFAYRKTNMMDQQLNDLLT